MLSQSQDRTLDKRLQKYINFTITSSQVSLDFSKYLLPSGCEKGLSSL